MLLLSFDQATKTTAWSQFDTDTKQLLDYGKFEVSDKIDIDTRIHIMKQSIDKLIQDKQGEIFALESIQYQGNQQAYRMLAELLGTLKNYFIEREMMYFVIEPSKWRSTCNIKGRKREEQKLAAIKFVKEKFNIDASEDECEAICIGWHCVEKEIPKIIKNNPK